MTVTEIRPAGTGPVVLATIDGEERLAERRADGSWRCPFCLRYNYPPGSRAYSHSAEWDTPCGDRFCVVGGERTWQGLATFREREAQAAEAAARAAEVAAKRAAIHDPIRPVAEQLGFAWGCTKTTPGESYGDEPTMCEASGNDRAEYVAHMRGHGAKAIRGTKPIRLKRKPPAATLGKLDVLPAKWLHWEETHSEPLPCTCGHGHDEHGPQWILSDHPVRRYGGRGHTRVDGTWTDAGCTECPCMVTHSELPYDVQTATRRGQFWSAGSMPHTYWVLPFEPAPWEDGRAQPVELHVSSFTR